MRLLHSESMVFPLQFLYMHYWIIRNTFKRVTFLDCVTFPKRVTFQTYSTREGMRQAISVLQREQLLEQTLVA